MVCPGWGRQTPISREEVFTGTTDIAISLDGNPINDIESYYLSTGPFVGVYPDPNIYFIPPGPVTFYAAGVYLLFAPLPVGGHTISFEWKVVEGIFAGEYHETFLITVAGGAQE